MTPVMGTIARMELAIQRTNVATKAEKPKEVVPKVMECAAYSHWDVVTQFPRMALILKVPPQWLANATSECVLATRTSANFDWIS